MALIGWKNPARQETLSETNLVFALITIETIMENKREVMNLQSIILIICTMLIIGITPLKSVTTVTIQ